MAEYEILGPSDDFEDEYTPKYDTERINALVRAITGGVDPVSLMVGGEEHKRAVSSASTVEEDTRKLFGGCDECGGHNDGDHNDGDHNDGDHNDGDHNDDGGNDSSDDDSSSSDDDSSSSDDDSVILPLDEYTPDEFLGGYEELADSDGDEFGHFDPIEGGDDIEIYDEGTFRDDYENAAIIDSEDYTH